MATIKKKNETLGMGCIVQAIGLLFLVGGFFLGIPGIIIGVLICLALFIMGRRLATKYICSNCSNKIENKDVKICPVCNENLENK